MRAHIWIPTGMNRMFQFYMLNVGEQLTENRLIKPLRNGTEQMLDQPTGLFPKRLTLIVMGEEIDSKDTVAENRYFVNQLKKHLEYKNLYTTAIRIFLSTDSHHDLGYNHKAYDCFVAPGGFDSMAAGIGISLSDKPSFNPVAIARDQMFTFEFWVQRDGYWTDYWMYDEVANITWRTRP